jgi:predicted deacylase
MLIDPYLDPSEHNYKEFHRLLAPFANRGLKPHIEFHRSFCRGSGRNRSFPSLPEWQAAFRSLDTLLEQSGLSAEVFCWQDFHDRHLIADIIGIHAGAGFDVTVQAQDMTTWSCLSRGDRDVIQRQYDPATRPDDLKHRFIIGVATTGD